MYRRLEVTGSYYSIARNISCPTDEPDLIMKLESLCSENSCSRTVQEWIRYLIYRQETTWTHQDSSATVIVSFSRQDLQGPHITLPLHTVLNILRDIFYSNFYLLYQRCSLAKCRLFSIEPRTKRESLRVRYTAREREKDGLS
jgi:hypothetical protein